MKQEHVPIFIWLLIGMEENIQRFMTLKLQRV